MKYLLCFVLFLVAVGVAAPPLYFNHVLPIAPAIISGSALSFMCYLFDPTSFLAWAADMRKSATTWFHRGES